MNFPFSCVYAYAFFICIISEPVCIHSCFVLCIVRSLASPWAVLRPPLMRLRVRICLGTALIGQNVRQVTQNLVSHSMSTSITLL